MARYVARRLLWLLLVLWGVATVTFMLMHAVPGGPWDTDKPLSPATVEALDRRYGLDQPVWRRYVDYLAGLVRGDLGISYQYQDRPVRDIIASGLRATATIGVLAFALAVVIGVPLGFASAVRRNSLVDYVSVFLATVLSGVPSFVLGIFLVIVFSLKLHWLPTSGWGTWQHVVMPSVALGALTAAFIARLTRASVLDALNQDYVRTAYAKGLGRFTVYRRHILRNALIPVVTVLGLELAALVTGSFIIENLFAVPGVGRFFVQGVFQRDYGLIMGAVLFYTFVVALANLAVDLLYAAIDPRVRLGGAS